jgi:hypothetical protein
MSLLRLLQVSQVANYPAGTNPTFYPQFPMMASYVDQAMTYVPPLQQLQYPVWDPHMGIWVQYPSMSIPPFHPSWGAPQRSVFDRLKLPVHDRLGPSQSGLEKGLANTLIDQTDLMNWLDRLSNRSDRNLHRIAIFCEGEREGGAVYPRR